MSQWLQWLKHTQAWYQVHGKTMAVQKVCEAMLRFSMVQNDLNKTKAINLMKWKKCVHLFMNLSQWVCWNVKCRFVDCPLSFIIYISHWINKTNQLKLWRNKRSSIFMHICQHWCILTIKKSDAKESNQGK